MAEVLHIVEPTLENNAGHCHNFIASLCAAAPPGQRFVVWAGRRAVSDLPPNAEVRPFFHRRLRRIESLLLFRKLLRGPGRVFVSTAGTADLLALDLAAPRKLEDRKASLYFHWSRPKRGKLARYRRVARRRPSLNVLAPTPLVAEFLREAGFKRARVIPYPLAIRPSESVRAPFRHLLFAGAARRDKGFHHVVDLVAHLAAAGSSIPVTLQSAPDHYDKLSAAVAGDLERLKAVRYRHLQLVPDAMPYAQYLKLFPGAICLQPYDAADFADRVSTVTLDAMSSGAPVVTAAGTWMARVISRFEAGQVVSNISPESLIGVAQRIRGDYPRFQANALRAGATLREEHDPSRLLAAISG